jgi:flagellar biogenesis protein FliO
VGKWTRVSGRSPDERAGSDIPYLLAALLTALAVILLVAWAIVNLFF